MYYLCTVSQLVTVIAHRLLDFEVVGTERTGNFKVQVE